MLSFTPIKVMYALIILTIPSYSCCHKCKIYCELQSPQQALLLLVGMYRIVMYGHTFSKSMDQPGKVASPVRGQLNRKNEYFPVRVRA